MSWAEVKKINSNMLKALDVLATEYYNGLIAKLNTNKTAIDSVNTNVTNSKNAIISAMNRKLVASDDAKYNGTTCSVTDNGVVAYQYTAKYGGIIRVKAELSGSTYSESVLKVITPEMCSFIGSTYDAAKIKGEYIRIGGLPVGTKVGYIADESQKLFSSDLSSVYVSRYKDIAVSQGETIVFILSYSSDRNSGDMRNFKICYNEVSL